MHVHIVYCIHTLLGAFVYSRIFSYKVMVETACFAIAANAHDILNNTQKIHVMICV